MIGKLETKCFRHRHVNTSRILHLISKKTEIGDLLFIAAYTCSSWLAQAFVAYRYSDSLISVCLYIHVQNLCFTHCIFEWLDFHVKGNASLQWTMTLLLDRLAQHMFAFTHTSNIQEQILKNHQKHSLHEQMKRCVWCTLNGFYIQNNTWKHNKTYFRLAAMHFHQYIHPIHVLPLPLVQGPNGWSNARARTLGANIAAVYDGMEIYRFSGFFVMKNREKI